MRPGCASYPPRRHCSGWSSTSATSKVCGSTKQSPDVRRSGLALRAHPISPSRSEHRIRSRLFRRPTGVDAKPHGGRWPISDSTCVSAVAVIARCGRYRSRSCASSHNTQGTPTSCASRFSHAAPDNDQTRDSPLPTGRRCHATLSLVEQRPGSEATYDAATYLLSGSRPVAQHRVRWRHSRTSMRRRSVRSHEPSGRQRCAERGERGDDRGDIAAGLDERVLDRCRLVKCGFRLPRDRQQGCCRQARWCDLDRRW